MQPVVPSHLSVTVITEVEPPLLSVTVTTIPALLSRASGSSILSNGGAYKFINTMLAIDVEV